MNKKKSSQTSDTTAKTDGMPQVDDTTKVDDAAQVDTAAKADDAAEVDTTAKADADEAKDATGSMKPDIILASTSPRRKQLLEDAGVRFTVRVSKVDESLDEDLPADPIEAAKKLAEKKAGAVVQEVLASDYRGMAIVIGADTMVVFGQEIFGKPRSLSEGTGMLRKLSGNTHEVITAVSVWMVMAPEAEKVSLGFRTFADTSLVTFKELSDDEIAQYLRCGESFDKAGAYAAQGEGARLIEKIEGSLDTVIGLPVTKLLEEFPDLREEEA